MDHDFSNLLSFINQFVDFDKDELNKIKDRIDIIYLKKMKYLYRKVKLLVRLLLQTKVI